MFWWTKQRSSSEGQFGCETILSLFHNSVCVLHSMIILLHGIRNERFACFQFACFQLVRCNFKCLFDSRTFISPLIANPQLNSIKSRTDFIWTHLLIFCISARLIINKQRSVQPDGGQTQFVCHNICFRTQKGSLRAAPFHSAWPNTHCQVDHASLHLDIITNCSQLPSVTPLVYKSHNCKGMHLLCGHSRQDNLIFCKITEAAIH